MSLDPPVAPPPPFRNRRAWLIAVGILEIVIACAFFLVAGMTAVVLNMAPHMQRPPGAPELSPAMGVLGAAVYAVPGALFLLLGVGSIKCRDWARIGSQIASGFWLLIGIISALLVMLIMPHALEQQGKLFPEQIRIAVIIMGLFTGVLMVLLPAALLVFYSLKSVRATCQAGGLGQEAGSRPVPVIVLAILEGFGIFAVLSLLIVRATVVFGIVVHAPAAILLYTAHGVLSGVVAWLLWKRSYTGWAICFFKLLFWSTSWVVTLMRRDLLEVYQEIGLSGQQLQQIAPIPHFQSFILGSTWVGMAVYLGFIIYSRKFFLPAGEKGQKA